MNAICPMCLRSNPTSALFCYFDGVSLSHQQHEQPSNIGDVPFTIPFVLPGGTQCLNFNQLVLACQNNWQTAREILAQGRWVKYFAGLGRADLAEAARIAAQDADLDRGLSQFLERLPADTLEPAKLLVEPAELIFDHLMPGKDDGFELMAVNQGMLLLYGVATSNCDWLAFDERGTQSQKLFQTMHRLGISVRILGNKLRAAAKPMEAEIVIESNGGTMKVPIRAEIAIRPFATGVLTGARSPREIAAKAKAQPKDAIPLFDSGAVKAWYQTNGWTYPISAPCIATGAGALQQFLELLGLTKPPRLAIDTEQLRFSGKSGKLLIGQIVVSTQENVPVFLHAVSDQEWLTLQAVKSRNGKATLPFEIVIPPRSGETLTAQITIEGNGKQQFVVPVRLTIADKPLMGLPATPANKPLMGLPATPSASSVKLPTAEPGAGTALPPMAAVLDPAPAAIDASIQPSSIVGSSGKRLTTLVRDAVEAAVGQAEPRRKGINELNVLALTVGLIGLAVTWPFGSAGFGILLAASGLASACIAMLLLLIRRGTAYTLPALGALINAQGLAMALILYWYPPKPPVEQPPQLVVGPAKPNFPAIADVRTALASTDPAERVKGVTAVGELARNLATTRVDLLTALQDPDETVRAAAADALGQMGPPARVTFPVLLRIAKTDASENARKHAEQAMKKINSPNRTDLSEFLVALTDDNAGMRAAAALALGQIGPEARDAAAALDKALGDSDVGVCVCAAQALWEIQRQQAKGIVKVLVDGLQDKTRSDARARAADVLGRMRSTEPKALDALETALRDGEADVRIEAAFALGSIGAPRSMPKFVKALGDSEIKVRMVAAQALWLYEKDVRGVSVLIKALDDADADIRVTAAVALGKFGEKAEPAVHALALALKDRDAGVRARAAEALHHIGPAASLAVPALREALHNPDASLRSHAAYALSAMKAEARPAIPELRQALQDQDTGVRLFAARALWAVDGKADVVLPVIVKILREEKKDALQRARGAATLGFLGARAASVVPELHDALFDPDGGVRAAAARAIGEIGGAQARVAYPTLTDLAKADQADEAVRAAASEALKRIGRPTKADLDTLIQALAHNQPRFRASAAVCLWLMNREAKRAAFALGERLADKDENVSTTAAYALASIGPDAAVPALRNALKDKDEGRRGRAAFTLGEIGPNAGDAALDLNQLLATETEKPIRFHAARPCGPERSRQLAGRKRRCRCRRCLEENEKVILHESWGFLT